MRGLHNYSYEARLKYLDLQSFELRRLAVVVDLIWCYTIVFGLVDVDVNDFFVLSSASHTRGHVYKLYKPYSSGIRSSFFSERIINVWNSLPADP